MPCFIEKNTTYNVEDIDNLSEIDIPIDKEGGEEILEHIKPSVPTFDQCGLYDI